MYGCFCSARKRNCIHVPKEAVLNGITLKSPKIFKAHRSIYDFASPSRETAAQASRPLTGLGSYTTEDHTFPRPIYEFRHDWRSARLVRARGHVVSSKGIEMPNCAYTRNVRVFQPEELLTVSPWGRHTDESDILTWRQLTRARILGLASSVRTRSCSCHV